MRWHSRSEDSRAANKKTSRLLNDLLKGKTRTKKLWEIYSKSHYAKRVKDSVPAGSNIITVRQKIEDALKNETEDVIEELKLEQAKQRAIRRRESLEDDSVEVDPLIIRK